MKDVRVLPEDGLQNITIFKKLENKKKYQREEDLAVELVMKE